MVLAAALGRLGYRLLRLALGADQHHPTAAGDDVADCLQSLVEQGLGLLEIDDVNSVADAKNVRRHLRVPSPGMMAEMDARFEQLTYADGRNCHG